MVSPNIKKHFCVSRCFKRVKRFATSGKANHFNLSPNNLDQQNGSTNSHIRFLLMQMATTKNTHISKNGYKNILYLMIGFSLLLVIFLSRAWPFLCRWRTTVLWSSWFCFARYWMRCLSSAIWATSWSSWCLVLGNWIVTYIQIHIVKQCSNMKQPSNSSLRNNLKFLGVPQKTLLYNLC